MDDACDRVGIHAMVLQTKKCSTNQDTTTKPRNNNATGLVRANEEDMIYMNFLWENGLVLVPPTVLASFVRSFLEGDDAWPSLRALRRITPSTHVL